jgi:predicted rRNA methylase
MKITANIIYGIHSVTQCVLSTPQQISCIYLIDNKNPELSKKSAPKLSIENINTIKQSNIRLVQCPFSKLPSEILAHNIAKVNHQGIIAVLGPKIAKNQESKPSNLEENSNDRGMMGKYLPDDEPPSKTALLDIKQLLKSIANKAHSTLLILDGITDPHNLGAIIRSAECFGVDAIIIPKNNSANPDNPVVAKTSSGAVFNLPVIVVNNISRCIDSLKQHEFWVAGTALNDSAVNLFEFTPPPKIAWVLGNEGKGLRRLVQENCDYIIKIPLIGKTQSLNVSVACGIALAYTVSKQTPE